MGASSVAAAGAQPWDAFVSAAGARAGAGHARGPGASSCWRPVGSSNRPHVGLLLVVAGLLALGAEQAHAQAIAWRGNWAYSCDFPGSDMGNRQGVPGSTCSGICAATSGCTKYTWTTYNGGTCWMKSGAASKTQAVATSDKSMVCGILVSISWQGDWAMGCDFFNNDLASAANTPGDKCSGVCAAKAACTHYAWTKVNGGTCWMKQGQVSKLDAFPSGDPSSVCGVVTRTSPGGPRQISVTNKCGYPVWMAMSPNSNWAALPDGTVKLNQGQAHTYSIPTGGWGGRFWPKTGCNSAGTGCVIGDSTAPCPSGGCQPPVDTKIEFLVPSTGSGDQAWYDVSLVDGYTLPVSIVPRGVSSGSCVATSCVLSLNSCPQNEGNGIGDLRVIRDGQTVACLSPCKKWNYPAPYGLGRSEFTAPGVYMCCPTPPISSPQCIAGPVTGTQYVQVVRRQCPTAYSFAYDDAGGLHACPKETSFDVTICP